MSENITDLKTEPKDKWWKITKPEIGREWGNPNWVNWATKELAKHKEENNELKESIKNWGSDILNMLDEHIENKCGGNIALCWFCLYDDKKDEKSKSKELKEENGQLKKLIDQIKDKLHIITKECNAAICCEVCKYEDCKPLKAIQEINKVIPCKINKKE